jgi:hypothetical protein
MTPNEQLVLGIKALADSFLTLAPSKSRDDFLSFLFRILNEARNCFLDQRPFTIPALFVQPSNQHIGIHWLYAEGITKEKAIALMAALEQVLNNCPLIHFINEPNQPKEIKKDFVEADIENLENGNILIKFANNGENPEKRSPTSPVGA